MISFKGASGRFSFHFTEVNEKCIEYISKYFIQIREISNFEFYVPFLGATLRSGRYHIRPNKKIGVFTVTYLEKKRLVGQDFILLFFLTLTTKMHSLAVIMLHKHRLLCLEWKKYTKIIDY